MNSPQLHRICFGPPLFVNKTTPPQGFPLWKRKEAKLLGRGAFCEVYLDTERNFAESWSDNVDSKMTFKQRAVKVVPVQLGSTKPQREVKYLRDEIDLMRQLSHKHIVQYYGSTEDSRSLCLFMEYMEEGSVRDEIEKDGPLKGDVACKYTVQIVKGLVYLHSKKILHRDIKCANVLKDAAGIIKLADFGISKHVETIMSVSGHSSVGTPHWMSPEVVKGQKYGEKADIWSVGITVYEMLTGSPPWYELNGMQAIFKIGSKGTKRDLPPDVKVSKDCRDFLRTIFVRSTKRPSSAETLLHKWLIEVTYFEIPIFSKYDVD